MNRIIDKVLHRLLCIKWHWELDRQYRNVLKLNNISDTDKVKEKAWLQKWGGYKIPISALQYRVFRHYIGDDINIVPEEVIHLVIEPVLNSKMTAGFYGDKNFFEKILPPSYLPKTILRKIRGHFYDKEYKPISLTNSYIDEIIQQVETRKIIIKPSVDGESGRGVMLFNYSDSEKCWRSNDIILSTEFLMEKQSDDIIVQEAIEQHIDIAKFNVSSVNTLRLAVYRSVKDEQCHVIGAIMRIGNHGSVVDNAHQGGCFIGINKNGKLKHMVCNQYGQTSQTFNGIDFGQDFYYPEWDTVISFAKDVCTRIVHHRLVALDIFVDKNGTPKLIEYNITPGTFSSWLFQYSVGSVFGDYTDEILEYCKEIMSKTHLYRLK